MDSHFKLGGLMGASPYSNVSIIDAAASQRFQRPQQMRYNRDHPRAQQYQQYQQYQQQRAAGGNPPIRRFSNHLRTDNLNAPLIQYLKERGILPQNAPIPGPVITFDIPDPVVQDIICRFILNVPEEEKFDPVRALFQIELAHWFFVDYYCDSDEHPELARIANIPFNQFAYIIFQKTPQLNQYYPQINKYLAEFRAYRSRIPTYGAILMNQELTMVLLVQGFRSQWGFPKGKINEVEDPVDCAVREVFEETGYNMRPLLNPNHFIESKAQDRNDRLYLIRGVDMKFEFKPQTNYEIKTIAWFSIDELPEHKRDTKISSHGQPINTFYTVFPYIKRLKYWVADKLEGKNRIQCFRSKWFNSDKDEEESNNMNCQNYGSRPGMGGAGQANMQLNQLQMGKTMTPIYVRNSENKSRTMSDPLQTNFRSQGRAMTPSNGQNYENRSGLYDSAQTNPQLNLYQMGRATTPIYGQISGNSQGMYDAAQANPPLNQYQMGRATTPIYGQISGNSQGMYDAAQANMPMNQLGRAMTPGEEILRSVQGGFSAFKSTGSSKKTMHPDDASGMKLNQYMFDANQGDRNNAKGSKSKKYLFPEAVNETSPASSSAFLNAHSNRLRARRSSGMNQQNDYDISSLADSFNISCSLWENFTLDEERIRRALRGEKNEPFKI